MPHYQSQAAPTRQAPSFWLVCTDGTRHAVLDSEGRHSGLLCSMIPRLTEDDCDQHDKELSIDMPGVPSDALAIVIGLTSNPDPITR